MKARSIMILPFLALFAAQVMADARESYRLGMEALAAGRFAAAEEHFHAAIAERGEERLAGAFRRAYLPHFQLGVTLAEQGDCRGAVAAWEESERQGQVQRAAEEYRSLGGLRQRCQERLKRLDAAQLAAEQALARATRASRSLDELSRVVELAPVWDEEDGGPSFAARQAALGSRLGQAEDRLAAARNAREATPFNEAKALAAQLAGDYGVLADAARQRLLELQDLAAGSLERLQAMEGRAHAALRRMADREPHPEELADRVKSLRDDLATVTRTKASADSDELDRLRRRLASSLAGLERAAAGPPESLRIAAEAFLAGDYEAVLANLEGEDYEAEPRAAAQACLLRAAAHHAFWVLGGATEEMESALEADLAECAALESPLVLDRRFFSPRFAEYYETRLEELRGDSEADDAILADEATPLDAMPPANGD